MARFLSVKIDTGKPRQISEAVDEVNLGLAAYIVSALLKCRNNADTLDLTVFQRNALDQLVVELALVTAGISVESGALDINRLWLIGRNLADTLDVNILQLNADDAIALGVDLVTQNVSVEAGALDINRLWLLGRNLADTLDLNILHLNADDKLEFGVDVVLSDFIFPPDSGAVTLANMGVTAAAAAGTEESISISLDSVKQITAYAEADGAGGLKNQTLQHLYGQSFKSVEVNDGNYTVQGDDFHIAVIALTAPRTIYINDVMMALGSTTLKRFFELKDESGSAGAQTITLQPDAGSTIDGAANLAISTAYGGATFYTNGTEWFTR